MRTAIWFLFFWVSLLCLTPAMLYAGSLHRKGKTAERDAYVRTKVFWWMGTLLRLAGVTVDVKGRENIPDGACVFAANHQGNFDIPILLCSLDAPGVVAKAELGALPFLRTWMTYLGCVFLDRRDVRKSAAALSEAAGNLSNGRSMLIFPEGTRSRGGDIGTFKGGAFKMAQKTGCPVVPVCIEGSYRAMEAHGVWIHPAHVKVRILPPVQTEGLSREDARSLGPRVETLIRTQREALLRE